MPDKLIGTIDVTPNWASLYPINSEWIDSGTKEQKQLVKDELLKLCKSSRCSKQAKEDTEGLRWMF